MGQRTARYDLSGSGIDRDCSPCVTQHESRLSEQLRPLIIWCGTVSAGLPDSPAGSCTRGDPSAGVPATGLLREHTSLRSDTLWTSLLTPRRGQYVLSPSLEIHFQLPGQIVNALA